MALIEPGTFADSCPGIHEADALYNQRLSIHVDRFTEKPQRRKIHMTKTQRKGVVNVGRILFAPTFDCIRFKLRENLCVRSLNVSKVFQVNGVVVVGGGPGERRDEPLICPS